MWTSLKVWRYAAKVFSISVGLGLLIGYVVSLMTGDKTAVALVGVIGMITSFFIFMLTAVEIYYD